MESWIRQARKMIEKGIAECMDVSFDMKKMLDQLNRRCLYMIDAGEVSSSDISFLQNTVLKLMELVKMSEKNCFLDMDDVKKTLSLLAPTISKITESKKISDVKHLLNRIGLVEYKIEEVYSKKINDP